MQRGLAATIGVLLGCLASTSLAAIPPPDSPAARQEAEKLDQLPPIAPHGKASIDHSGRTQKGRASFYARRFTHRRMADGQRMNPNANVVASTEDRALKHGDSINVVRYGVSTSTTTQK